MPKSTELEPLEVVEDVPEAGIDDSTFGLLPPWVFHDDDFPIAQGLVCDMLGIPQEQSAGCLNRAAERRREHVGCVVISEEEFSPGVSFVKRLSCSQRHPGLCYSKDRDIYKKVLQIKQKNNWRCASPI